MGAKGSVEAAKMNSDNWGHLEVGLGASAEHQSYILHMYLNGPDASSECAPNFCLCETHKRDLVVATKNRLQKQQFSVFFSFSFSFFFWFGGFRVVIFEPKML